MTMPKIRVPSALRTFTAGAADVDVDGETVRAALADLERRHPGIAARLFDHAGAIKPFIRIFVGGDDIGALAGLESGVAARDEIAIVPAIAGG
jgi:molybdopterin synthase sulfur carrier subunit